MSSIELDLAIRSGSLKIYNCVFNDSSPRIFLVESPRTTLELSLIPQNREVQIKKYLYGINPQGFVTTTELHKVYASGVRVNGKTLSGFDAVAHMLSRQLPIETETVEKLITKKFEQGFPEIIFITKANSMACENVEDNEWLTLKEIPDDDSRLLGLNKLLAKVGSHFRCYTSKTYVEKVYGID